MLSITCFVLRHFLIADGTSGIMLISYEVVQYSYGEIIMDVNISE